MLGSHLMALRGSLEAALVLGLLAAWLVRAGRRDRQRPLWGGAGVAAVLALAVGAGFEFGTRELTAEAAKALSGSLSVSAAGCVAWAVFRAPGAGFVAVTGFLVVAREGLGTALLLWATVSAARDEAGSAGPPGMVALGVAVAAVLGWLVHRGVLRVRQGPFTAWAGGALVVVAAGVVAQGVRDLQDAGPEGGVLAGRAFDLGGAVSPDRWHGALLEGVLNVRPDPTVLQVTVWALYLVPALALGLSPVGFGRSVPVGVEEQKNTDARAGEGAGQPAAGPTGYEAAGGVRGGDGADAHGERVRDRARRVGGRADGDAF
ncbi:FTR1 family protein [Streptomyces sp. TRM49041]|uniref:FTR1 family protein n=1 Tax=Streptomyces sp. TRM49041 TaxID=2603216 RepID=UPI0011F081C7|nr:FTR1 family protein [Streptomyces sp. TRM49041]